jgi:hypothetical protein
MALIQPVWIGIPDAGASQGYVVQWGPMAISDIGAPITETSNIVGHADRSVQVEGNFGIGGNVAITGSNDGTHFQVLNDPSMTPLNIVSPRIRAILEATRQIAPLVTAGDGTTAVVVSLLMRRLR